MARFPRIPGDMGNALTWPFPVLYKVVRGASPQRVVRERAEGLRDSIRGGPTANVRKHLFRTSPCLAGRAGFKEFVQGRGYPITIFFQVAGRTFAIGKLVVVEIP